MVQHLLEILLKGHKAACLHHMQKFYGFLTLLRDANCELHHWVQDFCVYSDYSSWCTLQLSTWLQESDFVLNTCSFFKRQSVSNGYTRLVSSRNPLHDPLRNLSKVGARVQLDHSSCLRMTSVHISPKLYFIHFLDVRWPSSIQTFPPI